MYKINTISEEILKNQDILVKYKKANHKIMNKDKIMLTKAITI